MRIILALVLAFAAPMIGVLPLFLRINPNINKKFNKRTKIISNSGCLIGIIIYISFIISLNISKIDAKITYVEYPIQYLTTNKVYFNDNDGRFLGESNTIVKKSNLKYNNTVVIKIEDYESQWLWKIPNTNRTYYVYLSEENYNRFQNPDVIYENK